jgi:quercetin dioxygenase-like cupin family protein
MLSPPTIPEYRRNLDDAPRQVAAMAKTWKVGEHIPLHMHRRGQLLHAFTGIMRVETERSAWIVPPARALWLPPELPHSVTMRSHLEMRTVYIGPEACAALPQQPVLVEISGLLR